MSTKCSIACGDKFHLYYDGFETDGVYLELEGVDYEASKGSVVVKIPMAVMATIQDKFELDVSYAGKTDEKIEEEASAYVDKRIARMTEAKAAGRNVGLISLMGCLYYGSAEDPREEQIAKGVAMMKEKRKEHESLMAEIESIRGPEPLAKFVIRTLPASMVHSFSNHAPVAVPKILSLVGIRGGEGTSSDAVLVVHSSMLYPNGDTISVYVLEADDGTIYLTDLGSTLFSLAVGGVKPTDKVVDVMKRICVGSGIDLNGEEEDGKFHPVGMGKATTRDNLARDFLKLVEAIAKVTTLEYGCL